VSRSVLGDHPAFPIPHAYGFALRREVFVFYPLLGLVAGLVAVVFIRSFFGAQKLAERMPGPPVLRPVVGGLVVGVAVWMSSGVLVGYGHLAVRLDVFGRMALGALVLLVAGKIFVTAITMGFGGTGGVFTPSLYLGAATGGAFGVALAALFPSLRLHPEAYALVGMGAMVAAATGAPITAILIVFEMTNDYAIVLPLMLTSVIALAVARHLEPDDLYSGWLRRRGEHLEHGEDRDVLAGLRVADTLDPDPPTVVEHATVDEMLDHLGHTDLTELPVVDGEGHLLGTVTIAELGRLARDQGALAALLMAADVAGPTETVSPADTLLDATRRMGVRGSGSLPVVDPATGRLVGVVTRAHVLARYEQAVAGAARG
jgi:chloride channel protein, CIC family